ncbi:MAG: protein-export chaperone SecB [Gammaproteobacteria bacterium]|nr:protein-export chaperone SecB [Gammaproteobacteria bacterium]
MPDEEQPEAQPEEAEKVIRAQSIYIKDASFESPNSPELFTKKWEPNLGLEISNSISTLEDDVYEVIITITATVSVEDKTAFLAEVHQAGIFILKGHDPDALMRLQHVYCLNTLYPYACAAISDLVTKGGFPQLLLAPVSFASLYAKKLQENLKEQEDPSDN